MNIIDTMCGWIDTVCGWRYQFRRYPKPTKRQGDVPPVMLELNQALGAQVTPQLSERQIKRRAQRAARRIQRLHAK